jgi:hypothetical protein
MGLGVGVSRHCSAQESIGGRSVESACAHIHMLGLSTEGDGTAAMVRMGGGRGSVAADVASSTVDVVRADGVDAAAAYSVQSASYWTGDTSSSTRQYSVGSSEAPWERRRVAVWTCG